MTKRLLAIVLILYYLTGQLILPYGNFSYLSQLPDLYYQYASVNGISDAMEFLEDNFLDMGSQLGIPDEDDPFEKEEQRVPFHLMPLENCFAILLHDPSLNLFFTTLLDNQPCFYQMKPYVGYPGTVFHPPPVA
jgi:hypothetical protein